VSRTHNLVFGNASPPPVKFVDSNSGDFHSPIWNKKCNHNLTLNHGSTDSNDGLGIILRIQ